MTAALTPFSQALLRNSQWVEAADAATSHLPETATEADVWDALEAAGLNGGTPRPLSMIERPKLAPRAPRSAAFWRDEIARCQAEVDAAREREKARLVHKWGRVVADTRHLDAAAAHRSKWEKRLAHAQTMYTQAVKKQAGL